jgi:hypothetical protein
MTSLKYSRLPARRGYFFDAAVGAGMIIDLHQGFVSSASRTADQGAK